MTLREFHSISCLLLNDLKAFTVNAESYFYIHQFTALSLITLLAILPTPENGHNGH